METVKVIANAGSFIGERMENSIQFRGIPYAEPPIEHNRFIEPQKLKNKKINFDATSYPNRSAQDEWSAEEIFYKKEFYNDVIYKTPISEDSLYLNIWTPSTNGSNLKPVMVYIHGGAFLSGTGHEIAFRTEEYAKRGIVLVTLNYRLGIFGFLAHPWLQEESEKGCGFYGILDQLAALDWVKENIRAFGGDPNNITICGQSAGAMSVQTLLATPSAANKFHKAIMQSSGGYPQFIMPELKLDSALSFGEKLLNKAGVNNLEELRKLSMAELLRIQHLAFGFAEEGQLVFAPVVNELMLKESVSDAIANGSIHKVPIIIGSTKDDLTVTKDEKEVETKKLLNSNINFSLKLEENLGHPSYVFHFAQDLPGDEAGAFHSSDLWYTFGTLQNSWRPFCKEDHELSGIMMDYWSNFMLTGNPNCHGLEKWEKCTKDQQFIKRFENQ